MQDHVFVPPPPPYSLYSEEEEESGAAVLPDRKKKKRKGGGRRNLAFKNRTPLLICRGEGEKGKKNLLVSKKGREVERGKDLNIIGEGRKM